jgi:hypothetical protein
VTRALIFPRLTASTRPTTLPVQEKPGLHSGQTLMVREVQADQDDPARRGRMRMHSGSIHTTPFVCADRS